MRIFLLLFLSCASLRVVPLPKEAELHRAKTDDGWGIELVRYKAQGEPRGLPVLLCHGISANARNMDLDDTHSMARWLASQGREAWTMSLRGTGSSDGISTEHPGPIFFDDFWKHDLPAAITYVRATTGAETIDYAGHSMGGMVVYAYLAEGGTGLHAVATLGSPTRLDYGTALEALLSEYGPRFVTADTTLPMAGGAGLSAPFQSVIDDGPFERFFYNAQNTKKQTWQRLMVYGTADIAGGVALQLLELIRTGRFQSADGKIDLHRDMGSIRTPVLVIAGRLDRIAVVPAVRDGYQALGGPKEWLLVTRANGAKAEYGHMDLVIGEHAPIDVWPKVLAFFHAPPSR